MDLEGWFTFMIKPMGFYPIKRNQRIHLNHRPFWSVRI
jgi:hypothetical protein